MTVRLGDDAGCHTPSGTPSRVEAALALATDRFIAGERVDVRGIARELGLARATMHRWFGTRESFMGEMLATLAEERLVAIRRLTAGSGAQALLDCFDCFNRELAATGGLRTLLAQEHERALRVLTSSGGIVHRVWSRRLNA